MSKHKTALLVAAAALGGMVIGQALPASAQRIGDILKGGAIVVVVDRFSGDIDRFVNRVTGNNSDNVRESTRVVPILSVGRGTYAGAVQVTGPRDLVDQVKAVAQVEGSTKAIARNEIRIRGLIPISSRSVSSLGSLSRVKGVGVSALVDVRL